VIVRVLAAALMASLATAGAPPQPRFAAAPPPRPVAAEAFDRMIRLQVEYDEHLLGEHGSGVESFIREAVAIHSIEWRKYRREWFEVESIRLVTSSGENDGAYVLTSLLNRTVSEPDLMHVKIVGRGLEVYSSGRGSTGVGGLAYRGSDVVVVSAQPGATTETVAYYLFHEIGHCFDAFDLPFRGGESTFGAKSRITFEVDSGNAAIIDESPGPRPRDTPGRAPFFLRRKIAEARALKLEPSLFTRLHDLLLHEPSPSNPAYVKKKRAVMKAAGPEAKRIAALLNRYEITPGHARRDDEIRAQIAEHYWNANEALRRNDYQTAEAELAEIRLLDQESRDIHQLVGAVERKIRRRR
jgi:hypothetical protein